MYTAEALQRLGLRTAVRDYESGAAIFEPGQSLERVYFLLGGTVRLYKEYDLVREFTSEILNDNEVFGLEALTHATDTSPGVTGSHRVRRQGAQALTECEVAAVSARELAAAVHREPELAGDLLEEAMYGVRRRDAAAELLAHRGVAPRLALALLSLGESLGIRSGSQIVVQMRISHRQLGQMTGCTREAVSKAVSELRSAGVAEAGREGVYIKDLQALTEIASCEAAKDGRAVPV